MTPSTQLPKWIAYWLGLSTIVVIWDALFVLCRPASFSDGSLGFIWSPAYDIYTAVDLTYGDVNNHALEAVCIMSLLEACVVAWALISNRLGRGRLAHLLACIVTSLTGAKTVLFFLTEAMHGWSSLAHNEFLPLFFIWILPNGLWVLVPFTIAFWTGRKLLQPAV